MCCGMLSIVRSIVTSAMAATTISVWMFRWAMFAFASYTILYSWVARFSTVQMLIEVGTFWTRMDAVYSRPPSGSSSSEKARLSSKAEAAVQTMHFVLEVAVSVVVNVRPAKSGDETSNWIVAGRNAVLRSSGGNATLGTWTTWSVNLSGSIPEGASHVKWNVWSRPRLWSTVNVIVMSAGICEPTRVSYPYTQNGSLVGSSPASPL